MWLDQDQGAKDMADMAKLTLRRVINHQSIVKGWLEHLVSKEPINFFESHIDNLPKSYISE